MFSKPFLSSVVLLLNGLQHIHAQSSIDVGELCTAVAQDLRACWTNTVEAFTASDVASCICQDSSGNYATVFDVAVSSCYPYAQTALSSDAAGISALLDYCANYGVAPETTGDNTAPSSTFIRGSTAVGGSSVITSPPVVSSGSAGLLQTTAVGYKDCSAISVLIVGCLTASTDEVMDPAVATCVCSDSSDASFGATFDNAVSTCVDFLSDASASPAAQSRYSSLIGYCGSYYNADVTTDIGSMSITRSSSMPVETGTDDSSSDITDIVPITTPVVTPIRSVVGGTVMGTTSSQASNGGGSTAPAPAATTTAPKNAGNKMFNIHTISASLAAGIFILAFIL